MLDTPLKNFAQYYQIDEMSEDDENDFEEDGETIQSSPGVPQLQIFSPDNEYESIHVAENSDDEAKLSNIAEERR